MKFLTVLIVTFLAAIGAVNGQTDQNTGTSGTAPTVRHHHRHHLKVEDDSDTSAATSDSTPVAPHKHHHHVDDDLSPSTPALPPAQAELSVHPKKHHKDEHSELPSKAAGMPAVITDAGTKGKLKLRKKKPVVVPVVHPTALSAVLPTSVPNSQAALTDLNKMVTILTAGQGLQEDETMTVQSSSGVSGLQFTSSGSVEQPDKIGLQFTLPNKKQVNVYADGKNLAMVNLASSQYTSGAIVSLTDTLSALYDASTAVAAGDQVITSEVVVGVNYSLAAAYLQNSFAFDGGQFSEVKAFYHGSPVTVVTETGVRDDSTITFVYTIDDATGLPVKFDQTYAGVGGNYLAVQQVISKLTVLQTAEPESSYSYTPAPNRSPSPPTGSPDLPDLLQIGSVAPNFTVRSATGANVHLTDYTGEVVVLDFWSTWCQSGDDSLARTEKISRLMAPIGAKFLPICTTDDPASFAAWLKAHDYFTMNFYFDPAGQNQMSSVSYSLYNVTSLPTEYVIGKDGKIFASFVGYDGTADPGRK